MSQKVTRFLLIWFRKYLVSGTLYEGPAPECTSEYVTGPGRFMAIQGGYMKKMNIKETYSNIPLIHIQMRCAKQYAEHPSLF